MVSNRMVFTLSAALSICCFVGAGWLLGPINAARPRVLTASGPAAGLAMPPWVTLTNVALGAFRGVAVDVLWYRTFQLQQQGQYFEANQQSHWITTLQPHFSEVWRYQAWNMAYNISVATHTPEERWRWVNKGIALLRDKGIVYNPTAIQLYRELSWIYFHKFGQYTDDMHWYYKRRLAIQWLELLGDPGVGATTQQAIDRFQSIVDAPDTLPELIQQAPSVGPLVTQLHGLGYKPDQALLRQIGRVAMFQDWAGLRSNTANQADAQGTDFDTTLARLITAPDVAAALRQLVAYLRKKVLVEDYHMDPVFMLELMQRYGPFDWRHPASHGFYWAQKGMQAALLVDPDSSHLKRAPASSIHAYDRLNTYRQGLHAMQALANTGRVVLDPVTQHLDTIPDRRFIPAYGRMVEFGLQQIGRGAFGDVSEESFDQGYENFLLDATMAHYLYGEVSEALTYYKQARQLFKERPRRRLGRLDLLTLPEFVTQRLSRNLDRMANTDQMIHAMLYRAFEHGLANNQLGVFDRFVGTARRAHRWYQKDKRHQINTPQGRLRLLPFEQALESSYLAYMQQPHVPLLIRSRVWANTPMALRRGVSDRLLPILHNQAQRTGLSPQRVFPPITPRGKPQDQPIKHLLKSTPPAPVQIEQK